MKPDAASAKRIAAALATGTAAVTARVKADLFDNARPGAVDRLALVLPYPPTVNTYWRSVAMPPVPPAKKPWVKVLISEAGRAYQKAVAAVVGRTAFGAHLVGPVAVRVGVSPPDRRRRDIDNVLKSLFDAVAKAGVLADDAQVRDLRVTFAPVVAGGSVTVTLFSLEAVMPKFKVTAKCVGGVHEQILLVERETRAEVELFAGLLDGTSPAYLSKPCADPVSVIGRCGVCHKQFRCTVEEVPPATTSDRRPT